MEISSLGQNIPLLSGKTAEKQEAGREGFFSEVLNSALQKLNETQIKADNLSLEFLTGEVRDIHQVTIAIQEAKLSMQLVVEVRNKIIEAYQEISRMQV